MAEKTPIRFMPLYSGGSLYLPNHSVPVVLDIHGLEMPQHPIPVFLDHDQEMPVGILDIVEVRLQDGLPAVCACGHYTDGEAAWMVKQFLQKGIRWESSIATFRPSVADVELTPAGTSVEVNGRHFVGPLKIFRRWKMREGSFVFFGADAYNNNQSVAAHGRASHFIIEREESM